MTYKATLRRGIIKNASMSLYVSYGSFSFLYRLLYIVVLQTLADTSDEAFIPEVDLTNKPWFNLTSEPVSTSSQKKASVILANIPAESIAEMGHSVNEMLVECMWNGMLCSVK